MSARTWLSWWGPGSKQNNLELFPKIRVPMLMVSGDADIFVSREYQAQLKKAAVASPRVDAVILDGGIPHEFTGAETKAAALAFDWLNEIGIHPQPRVSTHVVDLKLGAYDIRPGAIYEPTDQTGKKSMALMLLPDFADDVMLTLLDALGPRLAKAGYTVLIPQDRGSGWPFYRSVASAVSDDQRAWLNYLGAQGFERVAVVAHGWSGVMLPALLAGSPQVAGVALIQPPIAPALFENEVLGPREYAKAVDRAEAAVKAGTGGTTMIIAPYRQRGVHRWITHMATGFLSFWGPAGPAAPVPALQASATPVLLIDAGRGRFIAHDQQVTMGGQQGVSSQWLDRVADPFAAPDELAAGLTTWLDALPSRAPTR